LYCQTSSKKPIPTNTITVENKKQKTNTYEPYQQSKQKTVKNQKLRALSESKQKIENTNHFFMNNANLLSATRMQIMAKILMFIGLLGCITLSVTM